MGITELAPAKLNLTLDVGARRPDGYHDITSIMQSAALYDVVSLDFSEAGGIAIECPGTDLPTGPDNLAWKAADVFFRETNIRRTGISILAAAAATQPPCCGECVVYFTWMCPTSR